jgi:electron-transferring-flavoprotein dehydrogenase
MLDRPTSLNLPSIEREELPVDVLVVGAGPAGLACALRLNELLAAQGIGDKTILVIDKAEDIGHHILSGAIMDPRGIAELIPDWLESGFPVESEVLEDWAEILRPGGKHHVLKGALTPPQLRNHGHYIISLNKAVRWMAERAEAAGIEIYGGFPAAEILHDEQDRVLGVVTRDAGLAKDGSRKGTFEPGIRILAQVTVFAEGTRGNLAKALFARHDLCASASAQTYGTGLKELWRVRPEVGAEYKGTVVHLGGYPLGSDAYGGGWIYGQGDDLLSVGFVVGLDHRDATLDPHALFVQWKQHPRLSALFEGGEVLRYGAKTVPEGGYFSMPRLSGNGFVLVGDSAGFLNASTLKGVHLAIKSGLLAAEAIGPALQAGDTSAGALSRYQDLFEASWAKDELWDTRNYRQAFQGGLLTGMLDFAVQKVTGGRGLRARRDCHADHTNTAKLSSSASGGFLASRPKFNDSDSRDKLSAVHLAGAIHEEDQPSHLIILDPSICVDRCTSEYGNPCQHFCPAAVYEWPEGATAVTVNPSNCVHCKTCDIADPYENIEWLVPEGGGGPKYVDM